MDLGHWTYHKEIDPDDWFGFVYRIIDKSNGMEYIGKKQFGKRRRKKVAGRTNRKVIKSPSDWKTYTSSSSHLNEAIEQKGIENFDFIIESLHKTKASLHYAEVERQIFEDVLRAKMPDGTPKYYNKCIGNIKFIVPDENDEEKKSKAKLYEVKIKKVKSRKS